MEATHTLSVDRPQMWMGIILGLVGLVALIGSGTALYTWLYAEYTPREFIPYRTELAQIEPGYKFEPGYPSVTIPMEQFRAESAGKAFILSYPLKLDESSGSSYAGKVHYLLLKSGPAGTMYLVSSENIPSYYQKGSVGYSEHTTLNSGWRGRLAFISVNDGTSYWAMLPIALFLVVGSILLGFAAGLLADSNAAYNVKQYIKSWKRHLSP